VCLWYVSVCSVFQRRIEKYLGKDESGKEFIREDQSSPGKETRGWLLRTKGQDVDEGGVASGWAVLDSVVLV
jgi:hypothetical protein